MWRGDIRRAEKMITRGANIEVADDDGFTCLLIAARWGRMKTIQFLVEDQLADLSAVDYEGNSAHNLAACYHFDDVAEYLAAQGCSTEPNVTMLQRAERAAVWLDHLQVAAPVVNETGMEHRGAGRPNSMLSSSSESDDSSTSQSADAFVPRIMNDSQFFPVAQKSIKKAPRHCRLGVGSISLALFGGTRLVATFPYSSVEEVTVRTVRTSGELHVAIKTGRKLKSIMFQTLHAETLRGLIQERIAALLTISRAKMLPCTLQSLRPAFPDNARERQADHELQDWYEKTSIRTDDC